MRIKRIHLSNYRAFLVNGDQDATRYTIDLPHGENLLIYGENGSGKSSLFRALKDFFISANTGHTFQKNLFYEEELNAEPPFIDIVTDDNSRHRFSADGNQYTLVESSPESDTTYITQANITNGFISYRDLLKLHFRQANQKPDLVALFLGDEGLFSNMTVPSPTRAENKISFKDLWEKCRKSDQDAVTDYNNNIASLFDELEKKANILLTFFQKDCTLKMEYTDAQLSDTQSSIHAITRPEISFNVTLFGKEIPGHDEHLNEAKLTAIAISVFLAHQLCRPATDLRILFLDDIFIGLDMSNRIPLLKILTAEDLGDGTSFKDFQIFLTTYDREWFNTAKPHLKSWKKIELYVDDHSHKIPRPLITKSHTYREKAERYLAMGDYPACANYLRKAFEQALRNILPENIMYPGFNSTSGDNSIIALSKTRLAVTENEDAWFYKLKQEEDIDIQPFRFISLQQMIDQFKSLVNQYNIPFHYIDELAPIKNRLLNPLSHDDLKSSIFKAELIFGFEILNELQKIVSKNILSIDNSMPIQLYCLKSDQTGEMHYYRFELQENLRLFQYKSFRIFLNANFHSQFRTTESSFSNFEILEYDYSSLKKLCESIFSTSVPKGTPSGFYENFMFEEVFTAENKKLSELM